VIKTAPLKERIRMKVLPITRTDYKEWLLYKHYAHRIPSISYAFGLYDDENILEGVCTFGTPPSSNLLIGICGGKYKNIVIELNRLVLEHNRKNEGSYFVSRCLKKIDKPKIIVSFADTSKNHHGYIYQACNFLYTGLSAKRTNWKIKGLEHLHSVTIADMSRGVENRAKYMREKYGEDFYLSDRPRKHRYIYFLGSKKQIKEMKSSLLYPILPYPKGDNKKYDANYKPKVQSLLF
jgi:hypothetical protein